MSNSDNPVRSLAQYFDAPDDFTGEFGWVLGYSADASFMRDAAERFSRKTLGQRGFEGLPCLALMLDPGSPQLTPVDVPGVTHLPMMPGKKPFRLMHAKVAMLCYRHDNDHSRRLLRLIVSTGNWTRQTLEESLDLCWMVEIEVKNKPKTINSAEMAAMADIRAGWAFIDYVRNLYDLRILSQVDSDLTKWMSLFPKRLPPPRFFDNRKASLLSQLSKMISTHGASVARRHLSMGAGFFEGNTQDGVPGVLDAITQELTSAGLLTRSPEVRLFVNPNACQAIAGSADAMKKRNWRIQTAGVPAFLAKSPRTLHAKFLFSANQRTGTENCSSAWVYLGSGNLTEPGFIQRMSPQRGNLEAGVVFAPEGLLWRATRNSDEFQVVTNLLPVQWKTEIVDFNELAAGSGMPERGPDFVAAPVAWLEWKEGDNGRLEIPDDGTTTFDVLDHGLPCTKDGTGFIWPHSQPRQVEVRWVADGTSRTGIVPVRDERGRFGSGPLPALNHVDAWLQLASFPMPPAEEEIDDESFTGETPDGSSASGARESSISSYPIRDMMALVENIAQKQTAIGSHDWNLWLVRLEQTLFQMTDCSLLNEFKGMDINPLSPLGQPSFRPDFAETNGTAEGQAYERVLARVEDKWSVREMRRLEKA